MSGRLPDDHPAWRTIGAWVAARQRGEPRAVLGAWVVAGARERVAGELELIAALDGKPLRTGAELLIEATARVVAPDHMIGVQITLTGQTESGPVVSGLTLARLERDADGVWGIAAIFDDDDRKAIADPGFARFLAQRGTA
ncbi:MAG: hypothetical protein U1F43_13990 [Myxococcota bacterium]